MFSDFLLFLYKGHQANNRQLVQGIWTLKKQDEKYKELVVNEGFTQVSTPHQNKFISCEQTVNLAITKDNIETGHLFHSHLTDNSENWKTYFGETDISMRSFERKRQKSYV